MRRNKHLLFGGLGFVGGAIGSLTAELLPEWAGQSVFLSIGRMALWGAVFAAGILLGLTWALEIYSGRKYPSGKKLKNAILSGLLAGAIASGIAQAVFRLRQFADFGLFIFQSGCWGLAGAILGWQLSRTIPNLGTSRGVVAGLVGGWVGGMGFLVVSGLFAEAIGRLLGIGVLGAALGLAIVIVEALFREASLEVIWAPREITMLSLGPKPITIGGGDDHVHISGLPHRAAIITLEGGKIYYSDTATGRKTEFRDGSRIKVGKVEMVVHATK
jgi:hypothetical protein